MAGRGRCPDNGIAEWRRDGEPDGGALEEGGLKEGAVQTTGRRSDVALATGGSENGEDSDGGEPNRRLQAGNVPAAIDWTAMVRELSIHARPRSR